ncbi:MAG: sigma-70 family RNA polymerase sigma factor [Saprospiraceae bacterium]
MRDNAEKDRLNEWLRREDETSFHRYYVLAYPELLRYGRSLCTDRTVVQDCVQDLFVWMWQNTDRLREIEQPSNYVYMSLRNNVLGTVRQTRKRLQLLDAAPQSRPGADRVAPGEVPEDDPAHQYLERLVAMLPGKQMEVIYLRFYRNKSFKEIGDIMSVSSQVAQNYAARALRKLRGEGDTLKRLVIGHTLSLLFAASLLRWVLL